MSRFQGTILPEDVDTRKMGLDLLQKINAVQMSLDALSLQVSDFVDGLSSNQAVQTNALNNLTTIANTGSGNNVLSTSPTFKTSITIGV